MTGHSHSFEKWTTEKQDGPSKIGVFYDDPDGFGPCLHDVADTEEDAKEMIKKAKMHSSVVWQAPVWLVSTVKGAVGKSSTVPFEYQNNGPVQWLNEDQPIPEGTILIPHGN